MRHARWAAGHGPIFPAEITLVDDGEGAVLATGAGADATRVAIAHGEWIGVARVSERGTIRIGATAPRPDADHRGGHLVVATPLVTPAEPSSTPLEADAAPDGRDQRKDHVVVWTDLP